MICLVSFFTSCAGLPRGYDRTTTTALTPSKTNLLGKSLKTDIESNPGKSGFYLLNNNHDALEARALLIKAAEKTLDVQYYLFNDDSTGLLVKYWLLQAADRGVRVRVLIDDIDTADKTFDIGVLDHHPNISVRFFNPFVQRKLFRIIEIITDPGRVGRRMHNKCFVADNTVAIVGGRNIGDEYFSTRIDTGFADTDIISIGPVVQDMSVSFDEFWNSKWAVPVKVFGLKKNAGKRLSDARNILENHAVKLNDSVYVKAVNQSDFLERLINRNLPLIWAPVQLYYDLPEKIGKALDDPTPRLSDQVRSLVEKAQNELIFISPYFIPGKKGVRFYKKLRDRGIKIRILTNSLASTDAWIVHSGYAPYRKQLVKMGVELNELKVFPFEKKRWRLKSMKGPLLNKLHAKIIVVDRRHVFIGSANMDSRSRKYNTEIGVMIDSNELAAQVVQLFQETTQPENCLRLAVQEINNGISTDNSMIVWITKENNKMVVFYKEPMASIWRRIGSNFMRLFPLENQL